MDKLSKPDDLDELLQVNSKFSWLFLASMLCLILGGGIWGVFGKIVNRVSMVGAIQQSNPPQSVIVAESGLVDSIFYLTGDKVTKGQPIADYYPDNQNDPKSILSNASGELIELNIRKGDLLTSGKIVAKIQENQKESNSWPEFNLFVSEKIVEKLTIGQNVNLLIKGHKSESVKLNTKIKYIGKIPASDESIEGLMPNKVIAGQMKTGSYYLVRTENVPLSTDNKSNGAIIAEDLNGKIIIGEAIISQKSPIAYLFAPSK